ncbi:putative bifunctional diguanylate cyclase/phosphodiesterase [Actinoplanes sp. G11-F43]|uniref:putative bifunctional diguanylate cyclase/phosphodiesterase n=1 Tax=Actinoplanes sp. G11-F43 TaxID=3424130 RepID=UPI003D34E4C5
MIEALRGSRALCALALTTLAAVVLVLFQPPGFRPSVLVLGVLSAVLTGSICLRTARHTALGVPSCRFWWRNLFAMGAMTLATLCELLDPYAPGSVIGVAGVTLRAFGAICFAWALLRLSTHAVTRARKVALWLDITTLTSATMILLGHSVLDDFVRLGTNLPPQTVVLLITSAVGVFLVARLALGGTGLLPPRALAGTAVAAIMGGMAPPVAMLSLGWEPGRPGSEPLLFVPLIANLGLAFSGRFHVLDTGSTTAGETQRTWRRVLPYASVVAVDVLLLAHVHSGDSGLMLVTVGAVILTVLVVARQLVAARENEVLQQRFRLLVQNSTDIISVSDPDGRVIYCSPAIQRVLGIPPAAAIGTMVPDWAHPDDAEGLRECWDATLAGGPGASGTCRIRVRNSEGEFRWIEIATSNLLHEPSVGGILTNSRDVTETTMVQERLSHEATHDALTGLANRVLYTRRVEAAVAGGGPFSIVLVDLDGFKAVNDTLGHAAGDALLIAVAERMTDNVRSTDTVARLGGDEFAILFDGLTGDAVDRVLTRIAEALLIPVPVREHLISVRASFGVADACGDVDELLHRADIAMYAAKLRGEGGHVRYSDGMRIQNRNDPAGPLRAAVEEGELVLFYQPVVSLADGRLAGVEALVRWQHPVRGLLGPNEFIPLAEESGLIVPLGAWVIREAVRQAAEWTTAHGDAAPGTVAVNVSAAQLREDGFAETVATALWESGLPAARLCAEITESTAIGGGATAQNLTRLRELGVRLSLDDFGTGSATLSALATCPVDQIKLDRSFVTGPDAIPQAVIQLAHALGIEAVAEGIETEEQARWLAGLGYHLGQGFLYARPMPVADLAAWLPAFTATAS